MVSCRSSSTQGNNYGDKTVGNHVSAHFNGASSYRQRYVVGKDNQVHHPGRIMERQVRRIALEQSLLLFMGKVDTNPRLNR
jgi:hypothetical protein